MAALSQSESRRSPTRGFALECDLHADQPDEGPVAADSAIPAQTRSSTFPALGTHRITIPAGLMVDNSDGRRFTGHALERHDRETLATNRKRR